MNPHYALVAQRASHRCEYCRAPEVIFNFPFEVEHVIPIVHDGPDDDANLALACRSCNLRKSYHRCGQDQISQEEYPLFHPREDIWEDHFKVDGETGTLVGLTPCGRATIVRLDMNSALQKSARRLWKRLGLFP